MLLRVVVSIYSLFVFVCVGRFFVKVVFLRGEVLGKVIFLKVEGKIFLGKVIILG